MSKQDNGVVAIHGKEYKTVALRAKQFRQMEQFDGWSLETEVVSADESTVCVKATIRNPEGRVISTGLAEEDRSSSKINKTSALENCETSAIGRALSFLHPDLMGTEIASADELVGALNQQAVKEVEEGFKRYIDGCGAMLESISAIKSAIANQEWEIAAEAWGELDDDEKHLLWKAPTKGFGGFLTTAERHALQHEVAAARHVA